MAQQVTPRITPDELLGMIERGENVRVLDVRQDSSWESSDARIPGAIRVEPSRVDDYLDVLSPDVPTATYCT